MRSIEVVQQMIDWMEEHMEEGPTLQKVSAAVGYSPWYCSESFQGAVRVHTGCLSEEESAGTNDNT